MKPIVAYLSQYDRATETQDVEILQRQAGSTLTIKRFDSLTLAERDCVEVAFISNPRVEDLAALKRLVWAQSLWAGVDSLLKNKSQIHCQIVRLIHPSLSLAMAESVLTYSLYWLKQTPYFLSNQSQKIWHDVAPPFAGQCQVGLLGLGALARASAKLLQQCGFNVSAWSRSSRDETIDCYHGESGLAQLLGQSDIVVCLLPLTEDTRFLLNSDRFASFKSGACFINFARGAIVDDAALLQALDNGHVGHAVLDVFMTEPLPSDSRYWDHKRVTVLPHVSAVTHTEIVSDQVVGQVQAYFNNGTIPPSVDLERGY